MARKHEPEMKTRKERKRGGKVNLYNAKGSPEASEAEDDKDEFKKGGHVAKRKHGGHVEGEADKARLDKRARGGKVKHRAGGGNVGTGRGRSPLSEAGHLTGPGDKNGGHEGEHAEDE